MSNDVSSSGPVSPTTPGPELLAKQPTTAPPVVQAPASEEASRTIQADLIDDVSGASKPASLTEALKVLEAEVDACRGELTVAEDVLQPFLLFAPENSSEPYLDLPYTGRSEAAATLLNSANCVYVLRQRLARLMERLDLLSV